MFEIEISSFSFFFLHWRNNLILEVLTVDSENTHEAIFIFIEKFLSLLSTWS